ncbi:hypothetical protein BH09PAT2_BH09PAT2_03010 [soil metagenome]
MSERIKPVHNIAEILNQNNIAIGIHYQLVAIYRDSKAGETDYSIRCGEKEVGVFQLYQASDNTISFDIGIETSQQGNGLGQHTFMTVGNYFSKQGIQFITRAIDPVAVSFWEHLLDQGIVNEIKNTDGMTTGYAYANSPDSSSEPKKSTQDEVDFEIL